MATLKEAIYNILHTDAQSAVAGSLGVLLGYDAVTKPQCIFGVAPPESPDLPILTYFISAQSGYFPRSLFFNITAWSGDYEAVLQRVFALLHKQPLTTTDYSTKLLIFDWSGPELYDDALKCYYCQRRYLVKAIKV